MGRVQKRNRRRPQKPSPKRQVHELTIPDELIAWGKANGRAWAKPWGHEVDRLIRLAQREPLQRQETETLLARLEALCIEAIRAGQQRLLLGLDLYTADWLGLRFSFEGPDGPIVFGKTVSYSELHEFLAAKSSPGAIAFAMRCKTLVNDVFPQAQIDAIIADDAVSDACFDCGTKDATVMVALDTGSHYCQRCWTSLTDEGPPIKDLLKGKHRRS